LHKRAGKSKQKTEEIRKLIFNPKVIKQLFKALDRLSSKQNKKLRGGQNQTSQRIQHFPKSCRNNEEDNDATEYKFY